MKKFKYNKDHLLYLEIAYQIMNLADLTVAFNAKFRLKKTAGQIRAALKNHRIYCGRAPKDRLVDRYKGRLFTPEQVGFLRENYKGRSVSETRDLFNRTFETDMTCHQIKSAVHNRGITSGLTGHFPVGHTPWNAGTKGQGLTGANKTSFKPGNVPPNRKPLGSERICSKDDYVLIKVPEKNPYTGFPVRWKHKHVVVWEKKNGPVPDGHVVILIDGDPENTEPDNLMLVTRAELLTLNRLGYKDAPAELKPSILALAKLKTAAFQRDSDTGRKKMSREQFDAAAGRTRLEVAAVAIGRDVMVAGRSIRETARRYGVFPERVRQIVGRINRERP
jgi:hypothetical protein